MSRTGANHWPTFAVYHSPKQPVSQCKTHLIIQKDGLHFVLVIFQSRDLFIPRNTMRSASASVRAVYATKQTGMHEGWHNLIRSSNAEFDIFLVKGNAVEHGFHAFARPAPALMRFYNCTGGKS